MTPDWAPNRIKFRKKILPFYHEQYVAVGKYGTGLYDRIKSFILKLGGKFLLNEDIQNFKSKDGKIIEILTNKRIYKVKPNEVVISTLPISIASIAR